MSDQPIKILAGVPVSAEEQAAFGVARMTPPLGAVKMPCHRCGNPTWMGVRQVAMAKSDPTAVVTCPRCVFAITEGIKPKIRHLGGESGQYVMKDGKVFAPKNN